MSPTLTAARLRPHVPLLATIGAAVCWGSVVVTVKVAAEGLDVPTLTAIEMSAAAALLGGLLAARALARRERPRRPARGVVLGVVAAAALEPGVAYLLVNWGITRTSGTHAAVLIGLESAFVVLLSAGITRTVPPPAVLGGLGLAVAGAVVVADGGGGDATLAGDLMVLGGVLAAAGYVVVASRLSRLMDALDLTAYQFAVGWVLILPWLVLLMPHEGTDAGRLDPRSVLAAVATGVVGSVVAFLLYNWALAEVSPALAGISLTLIPVFGVVMSVLFLGDSLSPRTLLAALAVVAGLVVVVRADAAG